MTWGRQNFESTKRHLALTERKWANSLQTLITTMIIWSHKTVPFDTCSCPMVNDAPFVFQSPSYLHSCLSCTTRQTWLFWTKPSEHRHHLQPRHIKVVLPKWSASSQRSWPNTQRGDLTLWRRVMKEHMSNASVTRVRMAGLSQNFQQTSFRWPRCHPKHRHRSQKQNKRPRPN